MKLVKAEDVETGEGTIFGSGLGARRVNPARLETVPLTFTATFRYFNLPA